MKIYVFKRPDDSVWADYSEEYAKRFKILSTFEATTRGDFEALIQSAAIPRVRALADRALKELIASQKPRQPEPATAYAPVELRQRSFFGRVKWLFTGA